MQSGNHSDGVRNGSHISRILVTRIRSAPSSTPADQSRVPAAMILSFPTQPSTKIVWCLVRMPTFPNARYIMARREFEAAEAGCGNANDRTYEDNVLPIVEAGRAVLVDMDFVLDDEVWLEPTPGHSPGHVAIGLRSQSVGAVISGDFMHWPMQCIYPDWNFRFDSDPIQARLTRWAFLEACSDNGRIVMTSHFPLPSLGTIARRHSSFWFNDYQPR